MTNKEIINFIKYPSFWDNNKDNIKIIVDDLLRRFEENELFIDSLEIVKNKNCNNCNLIELGCEREIFYNRDKINLLESVDSFKVLYCSNFFNKDDK